MLLLCVAQKRARIKCCKEDTVVNYLGISSLVQFYKMHLGLFHGSILCLALWSGIDDRSIKVSSSTTACFPNIALCMRTISKHNLRRPMSFGLFLVSGDIMLTSESYVRFLSLLKTSIQSLYGGCLSGRVDTRILDAPLPRYQITRQVITWLLFVPGSSVNICT